MSECCSHIQHITHALNSDRFGFVGLRRRLELKVWGNRLTRCVAPTYHRCREHRLRCRFPKLWETLVVECHRRASSSITTAPVKRDTSLVHVQDSTQRTILEHELAIRIMGGESKFNQKKLPAVEPKIQVLKRRPANTAVLSAVQFISAHRIFCSVAKQTCKECACLSGGNTQRFDKRMNQFNSRVIPSTCVHLIDWDKTG